MLSISLSFHCLSPDMFCTAFSHAKPPRNIHAAREVTLSRFQKQLETNYLWIRVCMGDAFSVPFILSCLFILPIKHLIYLPINLHNHRIQFPLISRGFSCGKQLNKSPNTRNRVHLKDDNAKLRAEVIIVTFFRCNNNR